MWMLWIYIKSIFTAYKILRNRDRRFSQIVYDMMGNTEIEPALSYSYWYKRAVEKNKIIRILKKVAQNFNSDWDNFPCAEWDDIDINDPPIGSGTPNKDALLKYAIRQYMIAEFKKQVFNETAKDTIPVCINSVPLFPVKNLNVGI